MKRARKAKPPGSDGPGKTNRIPLSRPSFGKEEESAVLECLRSGWVSAGPRVAEFEQAFAKLTGTDEAVATSSGTAALHLALWSLGLQPGDEVITPSFTWVSVPNLITLLGARPVFCDVDPETLCLDLQDAATVVTSRTKAIVTVHFAGRACDMDAIRSFAAAHRLVVIEDAAHAVGGAFQGRPIGSHSPLCAFSFHPNKNITTCEGGMLTGLDHDRLAFARRHRYHGVTRDTYKRMGGGQLPYYDEAEPGLKYIMTDVMAAIGLRQLAKVERFNATRARLAKRYREGLHALAGRVWVPPEDIRKESRHVWHLFTIRVEDIPGYRDHVMTKLEERGIGVGWHYRPVHELEWVRARNWGRPLPHTETIGRTILSLPLYPNMTNAQVDRVVAVLGDVLKHGA